MNYRGFPIRKSPDRCLFAAPRGLSQLATSFIGSYCQGIHPALFFTWPLQEICLNQKLVNCIVTYNLTNYFSSGSYPDNPHNCLSSFAFWHTLLVIAYALFCCFSIQFSRYNANHFWLVVGSSGLEPPTSRLSGARSNHLSYEPI